MTKLAIKDRERPLLLFVCRTGRLRDIPLLLQGIEAAGYRCQVVRFPLAYGAMASALVSRWLGQTVKLIVSDRIPSDALLAAPFGADAARMLWNYADEFPSVLREAPGKRVCFFSDDRESGVDLFRFAPQPAVPAALNVQSRIVFVGDAQLDEGLPQGLPWWQARLEEQCANADWGFYLQPAYQALLDANLPPALHRRARVLTKNLLRLWIVREVTQSIGKRLQLVGSNWRQFGLPAESSAYSQEARMALYAGAAVHLDCGSKSGDSALYPRSSEIISWSGAPVQVACNDSAEVYGEGQSEIAFSDRGTLLAMLDRRLTESPVQRQERGLRLAAHLRAQRLTMADSVLRLFSPAQEVR